MIEHVDLHDATLIAVHVNWKDGTCVADIEHGSLGSCVLTFSGISCLTLPRKHSWGSSASINSLTVPGSDRYEIEMQSGDLIKIEATEMVFVICGQH